MEYILELKPSEYYVNACISIGEAMESLTNLTEIFGDDWVATEAKKTAETAPPVPSKEAKKEVVAPQKKANTSIRAVMAEWWKKFKQWLVSKLGGSTPSALEQLELEADETYPMEEAASAIDNAISKVMLAKSKDDAEKIRAELNKVLDDIGKKEGELKKKIVNRKVDKVNANILKKVFSRTIRAANKLSKLDTADLDVLNAQRAVIEKAMLELERNTRARTDEKFIDRENASAEVTGKGMIRTQQKLNKTDARRRKIVAKMEKRQAKKDARKAKKAARKGDV